MNNPPRVLIVEDEAVLAMLYRKRLKSRGYTVTGTAATREEAVSLAFKYPPDFVLMDIRLVGENDGIDAAREIAARIRTRTIFITGYSDEKIKNKAMELHPLAYLIKPFDLQELLVCMKNAIE
jgi:DNA-binding response OmpR family regulator